MRKKIFQPERATYCTYLVVIKMTDRRQQRPLQVDKFEDDLRAHRHDHLVLVPFGRVLHYKCGAQLEEVGGEAPGQIVAGPGVNPGQDLQVRLV